MPIGAAILFTQTKHLEGDLEDDLETSGGFFKQNKVLIEKEKSEIVAARNCDLKRRILI